MKTKILSALKTKCKDMGVSDNALTELTEISATNLKTDATDEDINAAVDSLVPFAKAKSSCLCVKKSSDTSEKRSCPMFEFNGIYNNCV